MAMEEFRLVIITGMSGAGKTQAVRALEDLGYFCVDNLPPALIPKFAELCSQSAGKVSRIALVVDIRGREFFDTLAQVLEEMEKQGQVYEVLFLEASDDQSLEQLKSIASQLSTKIEELSTEERKYLHLTGVFACNFTNHMYTLSKQVLAKINLPFDIALPLIDETASKVHSLSPEDAQTGPAVRFDENVMEKHLSLIDDDEIKQIYKLMSESIHRFGKKDI